jgi:hypothetical protein
MMENEWLEKAWAIIKQEGLGGHKRLREVKEAAERRKEAEMWAERSKAQAWATAEGAAVRRDKREAAEREAAEREEPETAAIPHTSSLARLLGLDKPEPEPEPEPLSLFSTEEMGLGEETSEPEPEGAGSLKGPGEDPEPEWMETLREQIRRRRGGV